MLLSNHINELLLLPLESVQNLPKLTGNYWKTGKKQFDDKKATMNSNIWNFGPF
jgi:hypothetical protein